jgi:hypothetical protein
VADAASCWMPCMFATRQCASRAKVVALCIVAVRTDPPLALRLISPRELESSEIPVYASMSWTIPVVPIPICDVVVSPVTFLRS